jgi:peptide/nickel transport system substrate-binding protein
MSAVGDPQAVRRLAWELSSGQLNRRDLVKRAAALGISASALAGIMSTQVVPALAQDLPEIPREETLIAVRGGTQGKFTEGDLLWNPFLPLANHQFAVQMVYEPLAFYSAFTDEFTMWLAESYEYSDDYTQLTVKTRPGVTWSDGTPFTAEDVAYTFNMLVEVGSMVKFGADVQLALDVAEATDETTTVFTFKEPAPRFFEFISYKFDIGVFIVPKHVFEGQDWATFSHYDPEQNWPVTTAPWRVAYSSPEQKVLDRLDSWWGEEAGVGKLPEPRRYIYLPDPGEQGLAAGIISNQYDLTTGLQPATFPTVFDGNEAVTTWSGREEPFGNVDWWPHSLYLNTKAPPYDDPDVRWALSYYLDRDQIIEFGWTGANLPATLFVPDYPGLRPFIEAVEPMFEEYPYLEHNPEKGDALLEAKGWSKNGAGMWEDETGVPVELEIISFFDFTGVGPVVVQQLSRNGIAATYAEPPDFFTRYSEGDYTGALFGHGGSYSGDVYYSLRLYQSTSSEIPGGHLANFSQWENAEFDALVDELYRTSPTETEKVMDIWTQAMALWLPELPDVQISQGIHRLPMNETYWTGWPTEEDPYINPAHFHLTFALVMHRLTSATA